MKPLITFALVSSATLSLVGCTTAENSSDVVGLSQPTESNQTSELPIYKVVWEVCSPAIVEPEPDTNGCVSQTAVLHGVNNGQAPSKAELVSTGDVFTKPDTKKYSVAIESGGCLQPSQVDSGEVDYYEVEKIALEEGAARPAVKIKRVERTTSQEVAEIRADQAAKEAGRSMVVGGSACPQL
ncbi:MULTISPECIES: hypothetical protein [unclassified Coleofasciculus]|uniref:hypothetical protein n=1 Tax=unclassified Coleofasciculus TaxID=2692782 RepID=UPI0018815A0E|nr:MULTISPECIES: hypothetical protein [unclassified Coleofasciculus]MBE9124737.1 hypothetical protein [Coleofasciculus sp. LEGE 07081]MBE9148189.1 hypothetical protein [Coleofasciculus sp. LEGE 07092]